MNKIDFKDLPTPLGREPFVGMRATGWYSCRVYTVTEIDYDCDPPLVTCSLTVQRYDDPKFDPQDVEYATYTLHQITTEIFIKEITSTITEIVE